MQTSALHDPKASYTPTVARLAEARRDRRGRFTRAAFEALPKLVAVSFVPVEMAPTPVIVDLPPRPYHLWFKIVDEIDAKEGGYPSISFVISAVCRHYDIRRADLISERRTRRVVRPRQMAMHLCRELTLRSFPHISRAFSGRDHTTAMHGHRKISELALVDVGIAFDLAHLTLAISKKWGMQ